MLTAKSFGGTKAELPEAELCFDPRHDEAQTGPHAQHPQESRAREVIICIHHSAQQVTNAKGRNYTELQAFKKITLITS